MYKYELPVIVSTVQYLWCGDDRSHAGQRQRLATRARDCGFERQRGSGRLGLDKRQNKRKQDKIRTCVFARTIHLFENMVEPWSVRPGLVANRTSSAASSAALMSASALSAALAASAADGALCINAKNTRAPKISQWRIENMLGMQ